MTSFPVSFLYTVAKVSTCGALRLVSLDRNAGGRGGQRARLVLDVGRLLRVEVDLDELGAIEAVARVLPDDLRRVHKILKHRLVHCAPKQEQVSVLLRAVVVVGRARGEGAQKGAGATRGRGSCHCWESVVVGGRRGVAHQRSAFG